MTYLAVNDSFLVLAMGKWDFTFFAAVNFNVRSAFILVVIGKSHR
jgi:hypothetical protein